MLILDRAAVERLLTMPACIEVMEKALRQLARGEVVLPLRSLVRRPDNRGFLGLMPAWAGGGIDSFGLKAVCIFPENPARGLDTHLGAVLLFSGETGALLGVMNASAITAIRTAAVTAVATKVLARPDSRRVVIFGSGAQARTHVDAMAAILDLQRVDIVARNREKGSEMIASLRPRHSFDLELTEDPAAAVRAADVVITVTSSREPILKRAWIRPGTHINLVGSSVASAREVDGATMAAGSLFVDRRESTLNESGDYLFALREGAIEESHIRAELGEVLTGHAAGRKERDEITIFKSLGIAVEDLAAADFLYREAMRTGDGARFDFD
jgi:ornithine cyclodeaminase/alanine dehydrogenase-like protein (mu-crystallin family)